MRAMLGEGERPTDLTAAIGHLRADHPELVAAIAAAHDLPRRGRRFTGLPGKAHPGPRLPRWS